MKIVLVTQNEPFFLSSTIEYVIDNLPAGCELGGVVVLSASPFGKKAPFLKRALATLRIFGARFFIHYAFRLIKSKLLGGDVLSLLKRLNIRAIVLNDPINSEGSLAAITGLEPDLLISIQGNQIFKAPLLAIPRLGTLNLHTALLPKYRGLMPTFWVLKNGENVTGASVFFVDEGIDSGPIVVQRKIDIDNMSQAELIKASKRIGAECLVEAIQLITSGNYELLPNRDECMTYYGFPTRRDVKAFLNAGARFF